MLDWVDDVALAPKWRLARLAHVRRLATADRGTAGAQKPRYAARALAPVLVRRVREPRCSRSFPPRTDTRVSVPMTAAQQEEHDALIRPIAQILARGRRRPLTQAEFLRLMTLLDAAAHDLERAWVRSASTTIWPAYAKARPEPALLEGLFAPKLLELRRIVESVVVEQGRKVVIFSQWRRMLRLAAWA